MTNKLLNILEESTKWLTAIELANKLFLNGGHETKRRKIRAMVTYLRGQGHMIIGDMKQGYYLTHNKKFWLDYANGRKINAIAILAEQSQRKKQVEQSEQLALF